MFEASLEWAWYLGSKSYFWYDFLLISIMKDSRARFLLPSYPPSLFLSPTHAPSLPLSSERCRSGYGYHGHHQAAWWVPGQLPGHRRRGQREGGYGRLSHLHQRPQCKHSSLHETLRVSLLPALAAGECDLCEHLWRHDSLR